MTSNNQYEIPGPEFDDISSGLDTCLMSKELDSMIGVFNKCLIDQETPKERMDAVCNSTTEIKFVSGIMGNENCLYKTPRAALGRYGIDFTADKAYGTSGGRSW